MGLDPGFRAGVKVAVVSRTGAVVDIGVHQNGLVHVSQLADRFVRDPNDVVKVGQNVRVTVGCHDTEAGHDGP